MKRPKDAQQLLLPLSHTQVLAGYLSETYRAYYGRDNYGLDLTDRTDPCIYASGRGTVLATGCDDSLGQTIVVRYGHVWNHEAGQVMDVVMRYCHLSTITVAAGMSVCRGDLIGLMGSTAIADQGIFLHLEVDTDLLHPTATPSLISEGDFLRPGNRQDTTTFCPCALLHIGPRQVLSALQPDWCDPKAMTLPEAEIHLPGSSLQVFEKFESALRATEVYLEEERQQEAADR